MTIAIIEPVGGHGGMDYYDYGLAYGIGSNNVEVLYYTCDKTTVRDFSNVSTIISFVRLWDTKLINKVYKYIKGHFESLKDAKQRGAKIVHLHFFTFRAIDYLVLALARLMDFKTVVTVHDVNAFDKSANTFIEKKCYNLIDGIIVHNESSYNDLKKKNFKIKNIEIIPHGNYKPFIEAFPSRNIKTRKADFSLLFFGQIKRVKGLDILLKAIKIVKDKGYNNIHLTVAGKAWKSDLDYYIELINELGIQNEVETNFRYIPDDQVASFYAKADLVILPYTEIYQSGVILLTMSYGKPVLCSDLDAFKEIVVDEQTGFLFKNKNEIDLANKIIYLYNHQEIINQVTSNSSILMDTKYDWINIGRKTVDFYRLLKK